MLGMPWATCSLTWLARCQAHLGNLIVGKHRARSRLPGCPAGQAAIPLLQRLQGSPRDSLPCCKQPAGTDFSSLTQCGGLGNCRGERVCAAPARLEMPHWAEEPPRDASRARAWAEVHAPVPALHAVATRAQGLCRSTPLQKGYQGSQPRRAMPCALATARQGRSGACSAGHAARQGELQRGAADAYQRVFPHPLPGSQWGRAGEAGCW